MKLEIGQKSVKNQYYAAICVNILSMSYGATCGWPSSNFLILQSSNSPLETGPITPEEASWVCSIICIGGLIGNFFFGWLANYFGRKISIMLIVVPTVLSLGLIIIGTTIEFLLIARFLGGLAGGGVFCLIPLYITEISEDKIRGTLGSYLILSCNFGLIATYILGYYLDYYTIPYVLLIFPLIFMVLFPFLPETPQQLLKVQKIKEAENSLRYFRNLRKATKESHESFNLELEKLMTDFLVDPKTMEKGDDKILWSDFTTKPAIKSFIIGLALIALNQFCGCFAMLNYTATIFVKAGSTLSPNMSAIIVGVIQLIGTYCSFILVERAGRKILLSGSAFGTGIGLLCMGIYTYLDSHSDYNVSNYNWIPLVSFSFTMFITSWGVLSLPFLVLSEICSPKTRAIISGIVMAVLWLFAFIMIKYLTEFINLLDMHGALFVFAAVSFSGGIFVLAYVPETKGKSSDEILAMLE